MRTLPLLLALSLLSGCEATVEATAPPGSEVAPLFQEGPAAFPSRIPYSGTTRQYTDEVANADLLVAAMQARVDASPTIWIYREQLAGVLLTRARLTGSWDDYAAAEQTLAAALEQPNAAPWSTLAALRFSMHQFDGLPELIELIAGGWPQSTHLAGDVAGRRGNLDLVQGRYPEAGDALSEAASLNDSPAALSALAVWHWRIGDFVAAESLFVQAASGYHAPTAEPRAWFHLNLGLLDLDRGRWSEALSHYRDAERELAGSWLVEEHIAEVLVLLGQTAEAEAIYRDVIERTDGPEFMDALSDLLAERGDTVEADQWRAAARQRWEEALLDFPEAAYGHALGHYLDSGDLPERALELAVANHDLRPGGDSKVALAEALLLNDQLPEARVVIEQALASMYRSADLHAVAYVVYTRLGEDVLAAAQRDLALSLNPSSID